MSSSAIVNPDGYYSYGTELLRAAAMANSRVFKVYNLFNLKKKVNFFYYFQIVCAAIGVLLGTSCIFCLAKAFTYYCTPKKSFRKKIKYEPGNFFTKLTPTLAG